MHRLRKSRAILFSFAFLVAAASAFLAAPPSHAGRAAHAHLTRSAVPTRLLALRWARTQRGRWYCWGGTGPSCYDCSGLVTAAYQQAGTDLPRTTYGMLASPHLEPVLPAEALPGDLAFYGSGHVELVTVWPRTTFGSLESGTRVGWHHWSRWWHPTMFFRVK
jgi:cell wall-associated NlpC family hydrolase